MKKGDYQMLVVSDPCGIKNRCNVCGKILSEGQHVLVLKIKEGDREGQYWVGVIPPRECCGGNKKERRLFSSKKEAEEGILQVVADLERQEITDGLWLFPAEEDLLSYGLQL